MIAELSDKMHKTIEVAKKQLGTIRTGRASADLLARIHVEYYGSLVPLQQVAAVSVPESSVLLLNIFDKGAVKSVEKAIQTSDLGLNPSVDGSIIRLRLPELTEERRKELVKVVKKQIEDGKVSIRNIRRDFLESVKKDKSISEDELKKMQDDAQRETDKHTELLEKIGKDKEIEILKV